jgi:hydroxymethylglutaryl-CoA reductase
MNKRIEGFSKLTKKEKIDWITNTHFAFPEEAGAKLESYWNSDFKLQKRHDEFIENTLSNFYLPLGVAPNFIINNTEYTLPIVIEESSVVAAAGNAAKFWSKRGGFKAKVIDTVKLGHVHFIFEGSFIELETFFIKKKSELLKATKALTQNMEKRGGGIIDIQLIDKSDSLKDYYQLQANFKTADAMGANFINSCLECLADKFQKLVQIEPSFHQIELDIVMSILSNYVPECLVQAEVSCKLENLEPQEGMSGAVFAKKIIQAINIANCEPYRAVTHNKGIMNGVDGLILATGNDFRAIEAGVHAYAARSGHYRSLSSARIEKNQFIMEVTLPLALGTVGGLTKLHPLVVWSMELLGNPDAKTLMKIVAVAGLAQNFAALRSLVTSGIQKGHMKMHLLNILNQFKANNFQKEAALTYFKTNTVSVKAVDDFLQKKH